MPSVFIFCAVFLLMHFSLLMMMVLCSSFCGRAQFHARQNNKRRRNEVVGSIKKEKETKIEVKRYLSPQKDGWCLSQVVRCTPRVWLPCRAFPGRDCNRESNGGYPHLRLPILRIEEVERKAGSATPSLLECSFPYGGRPALLPPACRSLVEAVLANGGPQPFLSITRRC